MTMSGKGFTACSSQLQDAEGVNEPLEPKRVDGDEVGTPKESGRHSSLSVSIEAKRSAEPLLAKSWTTKLQGSPSSRSVSAEYIDVNQNVLW